MKMIGGVGGTPSGNEFTVRKRIGPHRQSRFAALGLLLFALPACPQPAHALDAISLAGVNSAFGVSDPRATGSPASRDDVYTTLVAYADQIDGSPAPAARNARGSAPRDGIYDALRDYARALPSAQAERNAPADRPVRVAAAKPTAAAPKKVPTKAAGEPYMVGSAKCATCHADQVAEFNKTLMGRINLTTRKGQFECENCHGPGSEHVRLGGGRGVGGINGFHPQTPEEVERDNGICLGCHEKGNRTAWAGSTHEERGLACVTCHSVMRNITPKFNLVKQTEPEVCFQCHKLQRAQFERLSHMPVLEGKMTCTNCHNPHGSVYGTEALLDAPSINDNCYKCHADKRGPMLWEHAPVRENCLNCHEAHGSNHEYLLKVTRPRLCAECHAFAHGGQGGIGAGASTSYSVAHSCNNCHSQIHGSNDPSGTFFQR